jgi:hypothetical protein
MDCARRAWLDLYGDGSVTLQLEDGTAGYWCSDLDLGYPVVRAVTNDRAVADGTIDRTQFMGSRAVAASISAFANAGSMTVDQMAALFARYMAPSARPILHYVLDRPGNAERVITLRAAGATWPVSGPGTRRDIQLAWVAPDPIIRDAVAQSEAAWSGSSATPGRAYPLTYPRQYPPGTGAATTAIFTSPGDVAVSPLLRIYGPITGAYAQLQAVPRTGATITRRIAFESSFVINAGDWVDVDCVAHTALVNSDPTQPVLDRLDFSDTTWPQIMVAPYTNYLSLVGTSTNTTSQVHAIWSDGYLS